MDNLGLSPGARSGRTNGRGSGVLRLYPRLDGRNIPRKALYLGPLNSADAPDAWDVVTLPSSSNWYGIAQSTTTGRIVAIANGGQSAYSTDGGKNWTAGGALPAGTWIAVVEAFGLFIALNNDNSNPGIATSADGVAWTARATAVAGGWKDIIVGGGRAVIFVGGLGGFCYSSTDGITWTARTNVAGDRWTYHEKAALYVGAGGSATSAYTSPDLVTWTTRTNALTGNACNGMAYLNGKAFTAELTSNPTLSMVGESLDCINWEPRAGAPRGLLNAVSSTLVSGNNMLFALTTSGVQASRDGHAWNHLYPLSSVINGPCEFRDFLPLADGRVLALARKASSTAFNYAFLSDANAQDLYYVP